MQEEKNIYIFIQNNLVVGGIEVYMMRLIRVLKSQNAQIIWVKSKKALIDETFQNEIFDGSITVWNKKINLKKMKRIVKKYKNPDITIITFDVFKFAKAELFKKRFRKCQVHTFYFVPHFKGATLYPEEAYENKKREKVRKYMSSIFSKMNDNGNLRYFAVDHIKKMQNSYDIVVENHLEKRVPKVAEMISFDCEAKRKLAERREFNILTVSRFEFPHKGYIIGLIKTYGNLKRRFPQLKLTIVGYGGGIDKIIDELHCLDPSAMQDVTLVGKVDPDKLGKYYDDANVNISVAGCCWEGAKRGALSIPARHYTYDCEVYGYLPDSSKFITSCEPGEAVEKYIKEIINMTPEEYCNYCKMSYDTFEHIGIEYDKIRALKNFSLSSLKMREINFLNYEALKYKFRPYFDYLKHNGIKCVVKKCFNRIFWKKESE